MRSNHLGLAVLFFVLISSGASQAFPTRHAAGVATECNVTMPCDFSGIRTGSFRTASYSRSRNAVALRAYRSSVMMVERSTGGEQIVSGRPSGCPSAYCGCAASLRVFGHVVPELNLASNWLRFPRTSPAPGMVAARRGHVFVLERQIEGDVWMAYDGNSGGHATRIHARSLRGYAIVNPHSA